MRYTKLCTLLAALSMYNSCLAMGESEVVDTTSMLGGSQMEACYLLYNCHKMACGGTDFSDGSDSQGGLSMLTQVADRLIGSESHSDSQQAPGHQTLQASRKRLESSINTAHEAHEEQEPKRRCVDTNSHSGSLRVILEHDDRQASGKKYPCTWPGCSKRYSSPKALKRHIMTHTGEEPHVCKWRGCTKRFALEGGLRAHMRTHTGEKPYACEWRGCTQRFALKGGLTLHMRTHTGEKPYACEWRGCTKRFADGSARKRHMMTHTGEKPYACEWPGCGKSFSRLGNFKIHVNNHTT